MSDFKAKKHEIVCWPGLHPRTHWRSLQHCPGTPNWILRGLLLRQAGMEEKGDSRGKEGRGEMWKVR